MCRFLYLSFCLCCAANMINLYESVSVLKLYEGHSENKENFHLEPQDACQLCTYWYAHVQHLSRRSAMTTGTFPCFYFVYSNLMKNVLQSKIPQVVICGTVIHFFWQKLKTNRIHRELCRGYRNNIIT